VLSDSRNIANSSNELSPREIETLSLKLISLGLQLKCLGDSTQTISGASFSCDPKEANGINKSKKILKISLGN
jgi:hypothetical protein